MAKQSPDEDVVEATADDEVLEDGETADAEEFESSEDEPVAEIEEGFDGDDDEDDSFEVEEPLSSKEQSARQLEIRRAIEERREAKRMNEDLDYLDFDFDD